MKILIFEKVNVCKGSGSVGFGGGGGQETKHDQYSSAYQATIETI